MAARMAASAGPGTRTKTKKKHFVPQRVKVLRSADPLLGVLAWGIHHQVGNGLRRSFLGRGENTEQARLFGAGSPPSSRSRAWIEGRRRRRRQRRGGGFPRVKPRRAFSFASPGCGIRTRRDAFCCWFVAFGASSRPLDSLTPDVSEGLFGSGLVSERADGGE